MLGNERGISTRAQEINDKARATAARKTNMYRRLFFMAFHWLIEWTSLACLADPGMVSVVLVASVSLMASFPTGGQGWQVSSPIAREVDHTVSLEPKNLTQFGLVDTAWLARNVLATSNPIAAISGDSPRSCANCAPRSMMAA